MMIINCIPKQRSLLVNDISVLWRADLYQNIVNEDVTHDIILHA